jgi:hypothetical protein
MILYKYCPPERLDVLERRRIRLTPPACFNDPFEFQPVLKHLFSDDELQSVADQEVEKSLKAELKKYGPLAKFVPKDIFESYCSQLQKQFAPMFRTSEQNIIAAIRRKMDDEFNKHVGVLCLSEYWDSILMWGHYSRSHEGFVLGFDSAHQFFNQRRTPSDEFGYLREVRYTETRPVISSLGGVDGTEWFEAKAEVWKYEKEWRMFLVLSSASEVQKQGDSLIHLFEYPTEAVREIILGLNCSNATEAAIRVTVSAWPQMPKIFRAKRDPLSYDIVRDNI